MILIRIVFTILVFQLIHNNAFAHNEKWDEVRTTWSKLMLAVYENNQNDVRMLIENGAEINYTSLSEHHQVKAIEVAIRLGNISAFDQLMATDSIESLQPYLNMASKLDNVAIVQQILLNGGMVNDTLDNGFSMMMFAATFGTTPVMVTLLESGADINQTRNTDGWSALHLAAYKCNPEKVRILLSYGADKNYTDLKGKKAYDLINAIYDRNDQVIENKTILRGMLE